MEWHAVTLSLRLSAGRNRYTSGEVTLDYIFSLSPAQQNRAIIVDCWKKKKEATDPSRKQRGRVSLDTPQVQVTTALARRERERPHSTTQGEPDNVADGLVLDKSRSFCCC